MADRALGFAAAADAELAEPAAGLSATSGDDPDGYRTMPEVVEFIDSYARAIAAPVRDPHHRRVGAPHRGGYLVRTDRGDWQCRTRRASRRAPATSPAFPSCADLVPRSIATLTAQQYRNPGQLADGGVLVVGASASGTQIADEIQRSGRPVTLAVGEHIRAPRVYRGKDIQWWMDAAGVLDERYDEVDDIARARAGALAAARRHARPIDPRPQCADRHRRQAGRPPRRHHRGRQGAVLRLAAQHVRAVRSQDGPAAGHASTNGRRDNGLDGDGRAAAPPAAHPGRGVAAARHGSRRAGDPDDHLGDRLPARTIRGWTCRCSTARA